MSGKGVGQLCCSTIYIQLVLPVAGAFPCVLGCRHMNEPVAALLSFNQARKDSVWGERALFKMVKICINPDNEIIGEGMEPR